MKLVENIPYDIIGFPRLVRLNPNIPWKTRGNGAICISFGCGEGKKRKIGDTGKEEIYCYEKGKYVNHYKIFEHALYVVKKWSENDVNTHTALAVSLRKPHEKFYKECISSLVSTNAALRIAKEVDAIYYFKRSPRGLIGAMAAMSWKGKRKSYEVLTYRKREKWGTKRYLNLESVKEMDKRIKTTFHNIDYENSRLLITPNSPCPVLYGVRGWNPTDLLKAIEMIESEDVNSYIIYETNQGTDDHLVRKKIDDIKPYNSVIVSGRVIKNPWTIEGGHVFFEIDDDSKNLKVAAFEPTKNFRNAIRKLVVGDVVECHGGVHERPYTLNLEKIRILKMVNLKKRVPPMCNICGISMKSKGKGVYKCRRCSAKSLRPMYVNVDRNLKLGIYRVPPCARRHLSSPGEFFTPIS